MSWGEIDVNPYADPRWIATPPGARGLWATAVSWCVHQDTNGFVPAHAASTLGTARQARALVDAGLWEGVAGRYQFRGHVRWSDGGA